VKREDEWRAQTRKKWGFDNRLKEKKFKREEEKKERRKRRNNGGQVQSRHIMKKRRSCFALMIQKEMRRKIP